jgi:hypothetical protein
MSKKDLNPIKIGKTGDNGKCIHLNKKTWGDVEPPDPKIYKETFSESKETEYGREIKIFFVKDKKKFNEAINKPELNPPGKPEAMKKVNDMKTARFNKAAEEQGLNLESLNEPNLSQGNSLRLGYLENKKAEREIKNSLASKSEEVISAKENDTETILSQAEIIEKAFKEMDLPLPKTNRDIVEGLKYGMSEGCFDDIFKEYVRDIIKGLDK